MALPPIDYPPFADGSLDAGLWALSQIAEEGERFSLYAIGEVCGCSHEWIRLLEERALKKVRLRLRHELGMLDERDLTRENTLTDSRTGLIDGGGQTPVRKNHE